MARKDDEDDVLSMKKYIQQVAEAAPAWNRIVKEQKAKHPGDIKAVYDALRRQVLAARDRKKSKAKAQAHEDKANESDRSSSIDRERARKRTSIDRGSDRDRVRGKDSRRRIDATTPPPVGRDGKKSTAAPRRKTMASTTAGDLPLFSKTDSPQLQTFRDKAESEVDSRPSSTSTADHSTSYTSLEEDTSFFKPVDVPADLFDFLNTYTIDEKPIVPASTGIDDDMTHMPTASEIDAALESLVDPVAPSASGAPAQPRSTYISSPFPATVAYTPKTVLDSARNTPVALLGDITNTPQRVQASPSARLTHNTLTAAPVRGSPSVPVAHPMAHHGTPVSIQHNVPAVVDSFPALVDAAVNQAEAIQNASSQAATGPKYAEAAAFAPPAVPAAGPFLVDRDLSALTINPSFVEYLSASGCQTVSSLVLKGVQRCDIRPIVEAIARERKIGVVDTIVATRVLEQAFDAFQIQLSQVFPLRVATSSEGFPPTN